MMKKSRNYNNPTSINFDIVYNRKQTSLLVADDKNTEEQEDNKSVHIFRWTMFLIIMYD